MTLYPNVNTGPQMGPVGFTPASPYYDPNLPSTMSVNSPVDDAFRQFMAAGAQMAGTGSQIASFVGIGLLTDGLGDLGAGGDMVTVTHFTDAATIAKIGNGTGMLNAGTFVTLPSEVGGMTASEVEAALEIDAGKGAYSTTFQTPRANLGPAFNGPLTSGQKIQFQLVKPAAPGQFVPTRP
jgi:hypothetical protein